MRRLSHVTSGSPYRSVDYVIHYRVPPKGTSFTDIVHSKKSIFLSLTPLQRKPKQRPPLFSSLKPSPTLVSPLPSAAAMSALSLSSPGSPQMKFWLSRSTALASKTGCREYASLAREAMSHRQSVMNLLPKPRGCG